MNTKIYCYENYRRTIKFIILLMRCHLQGKSFIYPLHECILYTLAMNRSVMLSFILSVQNYEVDFLSCEINLVHILQKKKHFTLLVWERMIILYHHHRHLHNSLPHNRIRIRCNLYPNV